MAVQVPERPAARRARRLVLKTLTRGPRHGYAIARFIEDTTGDAVLVEEGSLYPALYRLERRGWVEAEWGTSELGRRAKLYRLTAAGREQLGAETATWRRFSAGVSKVLFAHMKRSLRSWLWRVPLDQEVDEELALHVEMRTRELVERGMDPKAARELALSRLGDVAAPQTHLCRTWAESEIATCASRRGSRSSGTT